MVESGVGEIFNVCHVTYKLMDYKKKNDNIHKNEIQEIIQSNIIEYYSIAKLISLRIYEDKVIISCQKCI